MKIIHTITHITHTHAVIEGQLTIMVSASSLLQMDEFSMSDPAVVLYDIDDGMKKVQESGMLCVCVCVCVCVCERESECVCMCVCRIGIVGCMNI
jgi:hypothetical protein